MTVAVGGRALVKQGAAYGKHGLFGSKLGEFGREFIAALWWEETVEDALALVKQSADAALQHTRHATQGFGHGDLLCQIERCNGEQYLYIACRMPAEAIETGENGRW